MRHLISFLSIVTGSVGVFGQSTQWAGDIIAVSSELGVLKYSARQILGKPNALPLGGINAKAWMPAKSGKEEFIKVEYDTPIFVQQIAIAESYSPGALRNVYTYGETGKEQLVYSAIPSLVDLPSRMLTIFIMRTPYKIRAIKLEYDGTIIPEDYFAVDAVAISQSNKPIVVNVNTMKFIEEKLTTERLSDAVNSDYQDLNPILSPDGRTLYFCRKKITKGQKRDQDLGDIWYSNKKPDGTWDVAKSIGEGLNNKGPNFVFSTTPMLEDRSKTILLLGNIYGKNGKMKPGMSRVNNKEGTWSNPEALNIKNFYSNKGEVDYFINDSLGICIMSLNREDTQGGRDLYVSFNKGENNWSEPLNLGDKINSLGDEIDPFLASDGKTLYFSSDGYSGFGKVDIYVAKRLNEAWAEWSDIKNLGSDINSEFDDFAYSISQNNEYAYYCRSEKNGDDVDIYRVKKPTLIDDDEPIIIVRGIHIRIKETKHGESVIISKNVAIQQTHKGIEKIATSQHQDTDAFFYDETKDIIDTRSDEEEKVSKKNSEGTNAYDNSVDSTLIEEDVLEMKHKRNMKITETTKARPSFSVIYFPLDQAALSSSSYNLLDKIIDFMIMNPKATVRVVGHTDSKGSAQYNVELSRERALSVMYYLKNKNISTHRIIVAYVGKTQPVDSNKTIKGRGKNRRVELFISVK